MELISFKLSQKCRPPFFRMTLLLPFISWHFRNSDFFYKSYDVKLPRSIRAGHPLDQKIHKGKKRLLPRDKRLRNVNNIFPYLATQPVATHHITMQLFQ